LSAPIKSKGLAKQLFSLQKDRTFFIQDKSSRDTHLTRWVLRPENGELGYEQTYSIALAKGETVLDVKEHANANAVAILTDKPAIRIINRVSGETVNEQELSGSVVGISWFGSRLFGYNHEKLFVWRAEHLSGVTTWNSLFYPQHYEGYAKTQEVWQTTSASDFQEAKFSLIPLLMGSIKASLLALFIALPVSLGAAIYTGFFARNRLRHAIKPAIEMLEAVPSVLIGFIAAIWLSPKAEQFLFSFAFFLITVPITLILIALIQRKLADLIPLSVRHGSELLFACLGILVLGYISVEWAPQWLFSVLDIDGYALLSSGSESPIGKTTIVVAIALGLAISPSIYSLAEDAISSVPQDLKYASFALGATRLQTLVHVVLHVALPGIVAAIMLGFGRAFGETMIVLMVTGNTPVASWGLIEGLRALTANLAIELPEADVSSAHYQILFLTACILFGFTFVVNTVAEIIRRRLRPKGYYG
jgi:phosphate transport system permease protein